MELLNIDLFSKVVTMTRPAAAAVLHGNAANSQISGTVRFYPAAEGTLVVAEVFGLPAEVGQKGDIKPAGPFYAFHIHDGEKCGTGAGADPFKEAGAHYNPQNRPHPWHAGDLPPLLGDHGYAYISFYTGRFTPAQAEGKTAVIHSQPDDFRTQPSGASGIKLACGQITPV